MMGCNDCFDKNSVKSDRYGNVGNKESSSMSKHEESVYNDREVKYSKIDSISYIDYLKLKKEHKSNSLKARDDFIKTLSDDYKRIQIDELVGVINNEEVHSHLSPEQALVALWEIVHHKDYHYIAKEFKGLVQEIDKRYEILKINKIELIWTK